MSSKSNRGSFIIEPINDVGTTTLFTNNSVVGDNDQRTSLATTSKVTWNSWENKESTKNTMNSIRSSNESVHLSEFSASVLGGAESPSPFNNNGNNGYHNLRSNGSSSADTDGGSILDKVPLMSCSSIESETYQSIIDDIILPRPSSKSTHASIQNSPSHRSFMQQMADATGNESIYFPNNNNNNLLPPSSTSTSLTRKNQQRRDSDLNLTEINECLKNLAVSSANNGNNVNCNEMLLNTNNLNNNGNGNKYAGIHINTTTDDENDQFAINSRPLYTSPTSAAAASFTSPSTQRRNLNIITQEQQFQQQQQQQQHFQSTLASMGAPVSINSNGINNENGTGNMSTFNDDGSMMYNNMKDNFNNTSAFNTIQQQQQQQNNYQQQQQQLHNGYLSNSNHNNNNGHNNSAHHHHHHHHPNQSQSPYSEVDQMYMNNTNGNGSMNNGNNSEVNSYLSRSRMMSGSIFNSDMTDREDNDIDPNDSSMSVSMNNGSTNNNTTTTGTITGGYSHKSLLSSNNGNTSTGTNLLTPSSIGTTSGGRNSNDFIDNNNNSTHRAYVNGNNVNDINNSYPPNTGYHRDEIIDGSGATGNNNMYMNNLNCSKSPNHLQSLSKQQPFFPSQLPNQQQLPLPLVPPQTVNNNSYYDNSNNSNPNYHQQLPVLPYPPTAGMRGVNNNNNNNNGYYQQQQPHNYPSHHHRNNNNNNNYPANNDYDDDYNNSNNHYNNNNNSQYSNMNNNNGQHNQNMNNNTAGSSLTANIENLSPILSGFDGFVYKVQFKRTHRNFLRSAGVDRAIQNGDFVIVEADRGEDLGVVCEIQPMPLFFREGGSLFAKDTKVSAWGDRRTGVKHIIRHALPQEYSLLPVKIAEESAIVEVCRDQCRVYLLPMLVVDAEYQYDRHKLTIFYESNSHRIDFRELVRDLFAIYKTRIWMEAVSYSFLPSDGATRALTTGIQPPMGTNFNITSGTGVITTTPGTTNNINGGGVNNIGSNGGIDLYAPINSSNNNIGSYATNGYDNTNQQLQLLDNNTNTNSTNATIVGEIDDNELITANNNAINNIAINKIAINNMGVTGGVVNGVPSMVAVSVSANPDRSLMSGVYRTQQQSGGNGINYNDYYTNNNNNNNAKPQSQQQLYNNNGGNNNMRPRNNNGNYQQQQQPNDRRQFPNIKQQSNLAYTTGGGSNSNEYYDYAAANTTTSANTAVSADDGITSNNYYTQNPYNTKY